MTIRSGLIQVIHDIRAYFTAQGVTAAVSVGWKERPKQVNQGTGRANRIVFQPSDDSGRGGRIVGARNLGQDPRSLVNWERYVDVSVWACDTSDPSDEEKQLEAVETLFEWVVRAVQATAVRDAVWGDVRWTVAPTDLSFGRELRVGLTYRHPLFDVPHAVVTPGFVITKNLSGVSG